MANRAVSYNIFEQNGKSLRKFVSIWYDILTIVCSADDGSTKHVACLITPFSVRGEPTCFFVVNLTIPLYF